MVPGNAFQRGSRKMLSKKNDKHEKVQRLKKKKVIISEQEKPANKNTMLEGFQ